MQIPRLLRWLRSERRATVTTGGVGMIYPRGTTSAAKEAQIKRLLDDGAISEMQARVLLHGTRVAARMLDGESHE